MDTKKLIGLRVKEIRKSRELTQEKLAELIELDTGYISKIELGINTPSISTFEKLAVALNAEIRDFFDFEHLNRTDLKEKMNQIFDRQSRDKQELLYKIVKAFE